MMRGTNGYKQDFRHDSAPPEARNRAPSAAHPKILVYTIV